MQHIKSPQGEMLTKPFLDVCKLILPVIDKFGAAMALVLNFVLAKPCAPQSVYSQEKLECTTKWYLHPKLGRAMDFVVELFRNLLAHPDWSMAEACKDAYGKTLKKYHGWIASSSFTVSMKLATDRKKFMEVIACEGDVTADMEKFCSTFPPFLEQNHKFLIGGCEEDCADISRIQGNKVRVFMARFQPHEAFCIKKYSGPESTEAKSRMEDDSHSETPIVGFVDEDKLLTLRDSFVSWCRKFIKMKELAAIMHKEVIFGPKIMRLSGLAILIIFEDEESRDYTLNNQIGVLKNCFDKVEVWSENFQCSSRRAWLSCKGIPPFVWSHSTFRNNAEKWGQLISIEEGTLNPDSPEYVWVDSSLMEKAGAYPVSTLGELVGVSPVKSSVMKETRLLIEGSLAGGGAWCADGVEAAKVLLIEKEHVVGIGPEVDFNMVASHASFCQRSVNVNEREAASMGLVECEVERRAVVEEVMYDVLIVDSVGPKINESVVKGLILNVNRSVCTSNVLKRNMKYMKRRKLTQAVRRGAADRGVRAFVLALDAPVCFKFSVRSPETFSDWLVLKGFLSNLALVVANAYLCGYSLIRDDPPKISKKMIWVSWVVSCSLWSLVVLFFRISSFLSLLFIGTVSTSVVLHELGLVFVQALVAGDVVFDVLARYFGYAVGV
ncbi:Glycolipid transfer protein 1 [Hibiscus syriacus]|uniref:Glycolipid transfer protein 1 n=1 Tax=Hibiscus syriacus TaxID=106335 RepID=A0A6A2XD90_HIBSY|nr:Glycolipid transfer protein 1 [Hibiscus syriacus]